MDIYGQIKGNVKGNAETYETKSGSIFRHNRMLAPVVLPEAFKARKNRWLNYLEISCTNTADIEELPGQISFLL
ncbi:MAG: hypothetical protein IIB82_02510 [Bacteroidetes bacterium]|nr:hypothetical protein [Bacteroidota bacterium]